ncbi:hypothetical protein A2U01_0071876, partial [Trifolium medium]|nr:hypothetical protein [Trifolium medium]
GEEVPRRTQSVADRVRGKRSQKVEISKSYQKEKTQKRKRKQESSSEFEPDDEDDVLDIVSPPTKKTGSKKAAAIIPPAPMDNISFHFETSAPKWKYVVQ